MPLLPDSLPLQRGEPIPNWAALGSLYETSASAYLWHSADGGADQALIDSLLRAIDSAVAQGLPAERYYDRRLVDEPEVARRDLLLSDALLRLITDMGQGQPEAALQQRLWHLPRPQIDALALARRALAERDPVGVVAELAPRTPEYTALTELYQRYLLISRETPPPRLPGNLILKPGEQSDVVPLLRRYLVRLGDAEPDPVALATAPDLYDEPLVAALQSFQIRHGLEVDGVLGPKTLAELNRPMSERLEQIRVNLERWRWMPRELGERYILVSPAGYFLELVEAGQVVFYTRTITGRPRRPTPSFRSDLTRLTVNPDWTVPRRIMREDLLPKIREDLGWLEQNRVRVQRYDEGRWLNVAPEQVDWNDPGHIRLIQAPGPQNALGRMKFGMDNPFSIYLHDTPAQSLFDEPLRPFSSGCVRVQGIENLVQYLLLEQPQMQNWLADALAQEKTRIRSLPEPVPVYMVYLSAWIDDQGQAQFRPDIYGLDTQVQARIQRYSAVEYTDIVVNN
ncbi:L,D-transpeptidase family protein [Marinobacterium sp. D7]|uniref:L,D-transpeptidase family protein n=1 Tax=Marinobacterium ramblicola TaxID=2849041 RepID=UPI001C2D666F|nr:L,D-transpeptidase family protein [Marinobacterium ramblicola]MBV1788946.1 L,D-transpeptidase family protein [Marinobacterium ramblicola]